MSAQRDEVLTPTLTAFDKKVLAALADWPEDANPFQADERASAEWRTAWQVAERIGEEDVATVRGVLLGLSHTGHAFASAMGYVDRRRHRWVKAKPGWPS